MTDVNNISGSGNVAADSGKPTSESSNNNNSNSSKSCLTRLPWGAVKEKPNLNAQLAQLVQLIGGGALNLNVPDALLNMEKKKPGEYLMKLIVFNFAQLGSKKFEQIINGDKRDKRLKECFQKNEDVQFDRLVSTMGQVAEHSLPSLVRALLVWHESQMHNLAYLRQNSQQQLQQMQQVEMLSSAAVSSGVSGASGAVGSLVVGSTATSAASASSSNLKDSSKKTLNAKQHLLQAKLENEFLDERKESVIHSLLCISLVEILKQLPFHPGIDDLLNYIIDLCFKRFLSKDAVSPAAPPHLLIITSSSSSSSTISSSTSGSSIHQNPFWFADSQFVTELYAEVLGIIAQSRFALVKRRFHNEFTRLKLNISPMQQQQQQQQQQSQSIGSSSVNMTASSSNLTSANTASTTIPTSSSSTMSLNNTGILQTQQSNISSSSSQFVNSSNLPSVNSLTSMSSVTGVAAASGGSGGLLNNQLSGSQQLVASSLPQPSSSSSSSVPSANAPNSVLPSHSHSHSSSAAVPIPGANFNSGPNPQTVSASPHQPLTTMSSTSSLISPTSTNIIKLLMGMKYFRIKMVPIEDFEASFQFLNDCAQYYADVKDKEIKHTLAALFVEILLPITGSVKNEVNIPCLKSFVDVVYSHSYELAQKSKHKAACLPLLSCLLCVSQRSYFLSNWFPLAQLCIAQFKKDPHLVRLSLECVLRLVWVYMVRVRGEKSSDMNQRLSTIVQTLFPRNAKIVQPKEMPSTIFVKIISYIAYERLDFAMKEIIYELLSIDNSGSSNQIMSTSSIQQQSLLATSDAMMLQNSNSNLLAAAQSFQNPSQMSSAQSSAAASQSNNLTADLSSANANQTGLLNTVGSSSISLSQSQTSSAFKTSKDNLILQPVRMEIGLKAFIQIADSLQMQKETKEQQAPLMPATFLTPSSECLSVYLNNQLNLMNKRVVKDNTTQSSLSSTSTSGDGEQGQLRVMLTDSLVREIGLFNYFEPVRRAFQDILKTLDSTIGRTFLMTHSNNMLPNVDQATSSVNADKQLNGAASDSVTSQGGPSSTCVSSNVVGGGSSSVAAGSGVSRSTANELDGHHTKSGDDPSHYLNTSGGSSSIVMSQMSKDLTTSENRARLGLLKTCVALIPRMMPMFKESELVEILTRLTIHIDDELKIIAFQTLKTLTFDYQQWRKPIFTGFTNFILKEISDMHPKLGENALKMLIQLLNTWKLALNNNNNNNAVARSYSFQVLDDCCQIIYHLEGFSLFTLCHSHIQRRRYALIILKECKVIGELLRCFRIYPYHSYTLDVLDAAAVQAMKQLHLQCFNSSLVFTNAKPDLHYLIELSNNWDSSVSLSATTAAGIDFQSGPSQMPPTTVQSAQMQSTTLTTANSSFYNIINKNQRAASVSNANSTNTANIVDAAPSGEFTTDGQNQQPGNSLPIPGSLAPSSLASSDNDSTSGGVVGGGGTGGLQSSNAPGTNATLTSPMQQSSQQQQPSQSHPHHHHHNHHHHHHRAGPFTYDPWLQCLALFFSPDYIFSRCPQARSDAWPFIYARLQQLLPLVDPNEQPHESTSRASILFGVGANSLEKIRRAASERDANLALWKNYLMGACCLTSGSDKYLYVHEYEKAMMRTSAEDGFGIPTTLSTGLDSASNASAAPGTTAANIPNAAASAINVDFTVVESTSKFYLTFGTATSLLKMIVPFLKCECNYFREIVIRGLGRINIEAMRDLIEELAPYIKECLDRRQEKLRRMRKRDLVRLAIVRIFEIMSEQRSLGKRLLDTFKKPPSPSSSTQSTTATTTLTSSPGGSSNQQSLSQNQKHLHQSITQQRMQDEQQLRKIFNEFVEGVPYFLDSDSSGGASSTSSSDAKHQQQSADLIVLIRLHFSLFIHKLIDSVQPKEKRALLFPESIRTTLFCLCDKWSGRFSLLQHNHFFNNQSQQPPQMQTQQQQSGLFSFRSQSQYSSNAGQQPPSSSPVSSSGSRSTPSHLYMHSNHYQHHNCYHYYDELELAATRACASILCAGNTFDYYTQRSSPIYTWLAQLLEHANAEMRMYDVCKCALPNEIYMLSMNVCVQLLDLSLHSHIANIQQQQQQLQSQPTINFGSVTSPLFEWMLHKCFGGISVECADVCFIALARVYIDYLSTTVNSSRPPQKNSFDAVYLAPILTLALLNVGSSRLNIHETSICLLKAVNKAFLQENFLSFFGNNVASATSTAANGENAKTANNNESSTDINDPSAKGAETNINNNEDGAAGNISKSSTLSSISSKSNSLVKNSSLDANQPQTTTSTATKQQTRQTVAPNFLLSSVIDIDIINSLVVHPQAQLYISEHMAKKNPELTMFIIAELTSRMEQCLSHQMRCTMFEVLIPWLYNIELVDPNVISPSTVMSPQATTTRATNCPYAGSYESSILILNNLFYLTHKFGTEHDEQLELLWAILVTTCRSNLKIVCRYVFVMITLATYEMLAVGKRVICYVARACSDRLVDELVAELECMDSYGAVLEKTEQMLPFYRYTRSISVQASPPPSPQPEPRSSKPKPKKTTGQSSIYFVNEAEDDDDEAENGGIEKDANDSIGFLNRSDISNLEDDEEFDPNRSEDDEDDDEEDEDDEDSGSSSNEDDEDEEDDDDDDSGSGSERSESDKESGRRKKTTTSTTKRRSYNLSTGKCDQAASQTANASSTTTTVTLPMPNNTQYYICPLNVILYHIGHFHHQQTQHQSHHYPNPMPTIYSYHNNYFHHNHYQHLNNLSRGSISLMLLSELVCTDGADFDWTLYLPVMFHFCLMHFDNSKQIVGEHAKKLLLGLLYVLTVQSELFNLTEILLDSLPSIIDSQSVIFDRKYTTHVEGNPAAGGRLSSKLSTANCHYNYNFNSRVGFVKGGLFKADFEFGDSANHTSSTRAFSNLRSAPSSPGQNKTSSIVSINQKSTLPTITGSSSTIAVTSASVTSAASAATATIAGDNKTASLKLTKKVNRMHQAKEHLSNLLTILSRAKNSPVWPYEFVTPHNYSRPLASIIILNEFVHNLKNFIQICFSAKQISTISSASSRSFSSPIDLTTRFHNRNNQTATSASTSRKLAYHHMINIDKKWSNYALMTSLSNSISHHYASRSLQIYRALGVRIASFTTMISLVRRLVETVADVNDDLQSYVIEILLTLKMNAAIITEQYVETVGMTQTSAAKENNVSSGVDKEKDQQTAKQKSKSLQVQKQGTRPKTDELTSSKKSSTTRRISDEQQQQKKRSSTANAITSTQLSSAMNNLDIIKAKSATLSRKQASQIQQQQKQQQQQQTKMSIIQQHRLVSKYKHQIGYKKSVTLSLFNSKWHILQERAANLTSRTTPKLNKHLDLVGQDSTVKTKSNENLRLLVQLFWTCICLLESDYDHEFTLAIEIIEQILSKIDLNTGMASNGQLLVHKNEFRTTLELFTFRINWPHFPGLQNLLMKGCTSPSNSTVEATQRLLVRLIPHCSKLNFIDPFGTSYYGMWGLSMNLISMLPTMIMNYERPDELCLRASEAYCRIIREQVRILEEQKRPQPQPEQNSGSGLLKSNKIENLKNLAHVMNLYATNSFGKDRAQWTKCVITYLSEFFQQCLNEHSGGDNEPTTTANKSSSHFFYFNWIVFLTELLEKTSPPWSSTTSSLALQSSVITCLSALLAYIDFGEPGSWSFINEELLRVVLKCLSTPLYSETMDLIRLVVSKSSSFQSRSSANTLSPRSSFNEMLGQQQQATNWLPYPSQVPGASHSFYSKKELPGRTLDFDFDFNIFMPIQAQTMSPKQSPQKQHITYQYQLPLNLISFHSSKHLQFLSQYITGMNGPYAHFSGWKRPQLSQQRTRDKLLLVFNTLSNSSNNNGSSKQHQQSIDALTEKPSGNQSALSQYSDCRQEQSPVVAGAAITVVDGTTTTTTTTSPPRPIEFSSPTNNDIGQQPETITTDNQDGEGATNKSGGGKRRLIPVEVNVTAAASSTTTQFKLSPNSSNNSSQNSSSVSSSNKDKNENDNALNNTSLSSNASGGGGGNGVMSSNNSLNQTSFIFSPDKNLSIKIEKHISADSSLKPSSSQTTTKPMVSPKPVSPLIADQIAKFSSSNAQPTQPHHHRTTSGAVLTKAVSVVSIVSNNGVSSSTAATSSNAANNLVQTKPTRSSTLCLANLSQQQPQQQQSQQSLAPQSNQHHMSVDDNNFINNTFSFLDDIDMTNGSTMHLYQQQQAQSQQQQQQQSEFGSMTINEKIKPEESFPWENAIYPIADTNGSAPRISKLSLNNKSKTLPPNKQLSSSFSSSPAHSNTAMNNGDGDMGMSTFYTHTAGNISSSGKPMAPKIKSPATIGVASGFSISETLKKLTNNLMTGSSNNSSNSSISRNDPTSVNVSSSLDQASSSNESGSRRRSVSRIISAASIASKNNAPSNSNLFHSASLNPLNSNLIYDHKSSDQQETLSSNQQSNVVSPPETTETS